MNLNVTVIRWCMDISCRYSSLWSVIGCFRKFYNKIFIERNNVKYGIRNCREFICRECLKSSLTMKGNKSTLSKDCGKLVYAD